MTEDLMKKPRKTPEDPRPSASIILVSPKNEILLLHRVQTSSSFPSAHVFPGGNVARQDGIIPLDNTTRHNDGPTYRRAAIRELFEESGIVLAKVPGSDKLIKVTERDRVMGRRAIHDGKVKFTTWLDHVIEGAKPDIDGLVPFTHWITPSNVPRRYTTQMYLYFLPAMDRSSEEQHDITGSIPTEGEVTVPPPTSDGGIENTAAQFLPASEWLSRARSRDIILFPPQYLLLHLISQFFDEASSGRAKSLLASNIVRNRLKLLDFVNSGDPPWTDKFISPTGLLWKKVDGRAVLGLDKPGPELAGSGKKGDDKRVILVRFSKEGPRDVEVRWKADTFLEERKDSEKEGSERKSRL